MSILTQKLTKKEKGIYLQALAFIMSQKGKANPALKSYLRVQALEIGVDEKQLEEVKLPQSALELCRSIKKNRNNVCPPVYHPGNDYAGCCCP